MSREKWTDRVVRGAEQVEGGLVDLVAILAPWLAPIPSAHLVYQAAGWRCEHCGHVHDTAVGYMLGVHHLDMDKGNCDWENLVALCQRCHLRIQAKYDPAQMWLICRPTWAVIRGVGEPIR